MELQSVAPSAAGNGHQGNRIPRRWLIFFIGLRCMRGQCADNFQVAEFLGCRCPLANPAAPDHRNSGLEWNIAGLRLARPLAPPNCSSNILPKAGPGRADIHGVHQSFLRGDTSRFLS